MSRDPRRKLLILIPTLQGGGAERVMVTLLGRFDRSRFRLALGVVDMRDARFRHAVPPDVEIYDLGFRRVRYAMPAILRLIWRLRPDVILSTLGHLNLALALLRVFMPRGTRLLARETIVVSKNLASHGQAWAWALVYRLLGHRFDTLICQSQDMRDDLVSNFHLPADKMVVINNPVDRESLRQLAGQLPPASAWPAGVEGEMKLVAAGRLVEQKGFDLLIEAMSLCRDMPVRLVILGEGPQRSALERLARTRGVMDRVHFAGFQSNPYPYFRAADAFVLSSRFEGFPNVVLEALACGTPVIAVPAPGGVYEILDGVAGCVVADNISAAALARAIRSYRGKTDVPDGVMERYSVDRITRRYEELMS